MKKFIMCIFLIVMCSSLNANTDNKSRYELSYKYRTKKSVRMIVREILKRKKVEYKNYEAPPLKLDLDNTIPIPIEDLREQLKNLA